MIVSLRPFSSRWVRCSKAENDSRPRLRLLDLSPTGGSRDFLQEETEKTEGLSGCRRGGRQTASANLSRCEAVPPGAAFSLTPAFRPVHKARQDNSRFNGF